jgi:tetratricopeptide (TPR) repeat protein
LRQEYATAAETALRAIGLRYRLPIAHFLLGRALFRLGRTLPAIDALEVALAINPHFAEAHRLLAVIHHRRLGDFEKAGLHRRLARQMRIARREAREAKRRYRSNVSDSAANVGEVKASAEPSVEVTPRLGEHFAHPTDDAALITVVSGLPRSGTSMVMQMLAAGGMQILADGRRQADQSNPRGYFEYERVKNLRNDNSWLGEAHGKAVKIITQLLPALPMKFRYRILYVERDLEELLASQRGMLARGGSTSPRIADDQLRRTFNAQATRIRRWLAMQPNVELHAMNHREIIANPLASATAIANFLGRDFDVDQMAAAVDSALYRSRS